MSYYAGNLSPISDFMENNKSPAMGKLAESAAMLRGKQNIFNIGLEKDNVLSAIKGDTHRELGDIQGDMYRTIKSNNNTSQFINTLGQVGGFALNSFASSGGGFGATEGVNPNKVVNNFGDQLSGSGGNDFFVDSAGNIQASQW